MPPLSFTGVLVIALIAVAVPVVLSLVPRLPSRRRPDANVTDLVLLVVLPAEGWLLLWLGSRPKR
jgi:hypothetical protein